MKLYIPVLLVLTVLLFACSPNHPADSKAQKNTKALKIKKKKSKPNVSKETITPKSVSISKTQELIDIQNIDFGLLSTLIQREINKVRSANRLTKFTHNSVLYNAAVNQNNYQIKNVDLTHSQNTEGMRTLVERVKFFGGGFQLMAENLIYEGFTVRTTNGSRSEVISTTYIEMAKQIVINWLKSPDHKKNILNKELQKVGTAVAYNPKNHAIYATQVFGKLF